MNETLLWLLYCVSAILAFSAAYFWRWSIILAMLAGGLVTGAGWALLYSMTEEEKRPEWVKLDFSLNLTFGLIFAGFGVALSWWMMARHRDEGQQERRPGPDADL